MILKPLQNDFSCVIIALYVDLKMTSSVNLFKIGPLKVKTLELVTLVLYISFLRSIYFVQGTKNRIFQSKTQNGIVYDHYMLSLNLSILV